MFTTYELDRLYQAQECEQDITDEALAEMSYLEDFSE